MYDQGHVVYPAGADGARRIAPWPRQRLQILFGRVDRQPLPVFGRRNRAQWMIYNLFMRKASRTENIESIAPATPEPDVLRIRRSCRSSANGGRRCSRRPSRKPPRGISRPNRALIARAVRPIKRRDQRSRRRTEHLGSRISVDREAIGQMPRPRARTVASTAALPASPFFGAGRRAFRRSARRPA